MQVLYLRVGWTLYAVAWVGLQTLAAVWQGWKLD